jgi:hypothetical protein
MTRKLGFTALEKSVYDRLKASGFTVAYNIYNYAPKSATLPYITFGEPMGIPAGTFGNRDEEVEENHITIHIWSGYLGDKECADIMGAVIQALTSSTPPITAYYVPQFELDMADMFLDDSVPSQPVRHGVMRFRIIMAPS